MNKGNITIKKSYNDVKDKIKSLTLYSSSKIVAVSKFQPVDKIEQLLELGHRDFAESRLEEASKKWPSLIEIYPDVNLHYIGKIQSRKVKKIVDLFDIIHTIDRLEIARKISKYQLEKNKYRKYFIQVNIGNEVNKSGCNSQDLPALYKTCSNDLNINIVGLMCIPPNILDPSSYFLEMQYLKKNLNLKELSMGMSQDYSIAIKNGATTLRIGRAIFGERPL